MWHQREANCSSAAHPTWLISVRNKREKEIRKKRTKWIEIERFCVGQGWSMIDIFFSPQIISKIIQKWSSNDTDGSIVCSEVLDTYWRNVGYDEYSIPTIECVDHHRAHDWWTMDARFFFFFWCLVMIGKFFNHGPILHRVTKAKRRRREKKKKGRKNLIINGPDIIRS